MKAAETITQEETVYKCNTPRQTWEPITLNYIEILYNSTQTGDLYFSTDNGKVQETAKNIGIPMARACTFDLPAGFTCPKANICLAYADRNTGKITLGKECKFTCYAAKSERFRHSSRATHWHNFDILKPIRYDTQAMTDLIMGSLPRLANNIYKMYVIRIHSSGDFFTMEYYAAWKNVASLTPGTLYYGYTKVLDIVLDETKPDNLHIIYSYGGKDDSRRDEIVAGGMHVPTCYVVNSDDDAAALNVPIACRKNSGPGTTNDINYIVTKTSFALLVH